MSKSVQLQILREEEKVLKDLQAKLKNQLTRLKVEELTFVNHVRSMEEERAITGTSRATPTPLVIEPQEHLMGVDHSSHPVLELDVNKQLLLLGNELEEEEEEEEEEEDEEEEASVHDQLTAFMKQLEKNNM